MKVVFYNEHWNQFWTLPPELVQWLRKDFPEIEFHHARSEQQMFDSIQDAEIFFGYRLQKQDVEVAKNLRWVHVPAASVYILLDLGLQERGITVTNSRGLHAVPIAEHVLGFMLAFSRKFIESWRYQQDHYYAAREILTEPPLPGELRGKTVLVLGLGAIGGEVARLCKAFGMRVLACKRNPSGIYENVDQVFSAEDFRNPLPESDYIVIAVPRTPITDGMIGEAELQLLKKSCVVINIARGKIIQYNALIRCLKENRIRGAALDVFDQEPLPPDSELFSLPNVFLTPHTSGVSALEHWPRMMELFAENLRRYIAGQPLMNVVDLNEGY
jgi:phosphoglycerate dehydrogenase-like enzyme